MHFVGTEGGLQPEAYEGTGKPLGVMDGEVLLMTDISEVVNARYAEELVAPLFDYSTATGDDKFREVIMQGNTCIIVGQ